MVQESIQNGVVHGGTSEFAIRVSGEAGMLKLQIENNGRGMERAEATVDDLEGQGIGLRLMKHRIELIDGALTFRNRGEGLTVTCEVPLPKA